MSDLAVGQTIRINDGPVGIIRFVGPTRFAPGEWVGVELDEGKGKNDGSVQGERYFDCPMGHGMFVRPVTVTVLSQPASKPAATGPASRKGGRPSSMFTTGSARGSDQAAGKRRSLNAPSPTPAPRTSRPSSITRSPTKSPTKPTITASSSASTSRTGTPSNARVASTGVKGRPPLGTGRTSMGPPAVPASRTARQASVSSTVSRSSTGPARTSSGRASLNASKPPARPTSTRQTSVSGAASASENGSATSGTGRATANSPPKSDDEILSPQPTNPVQAKTMALERLTRTSPAAARKTSTTAAAAAAAAPRPAASNSATATREIEDLKAKLRVLERKRVEDRDKLKNLEKIQGERDKFESIIQKLQSKYQPQQQENNDLKKQLKEAESRLETVEAIQADHDSAMELATLDREMAEETAEVLKSELEALKQKSEELELEVEVLREENAEFTKGMSPEERASTGWLQMERNNERLREALLRLRDITQQQEEELKDQIKSLEEDVQEFGALKSEYELSTEKFSQAESTIEDLRQQLDTALGAEDMIEDLTERNMSQAEQIEELRAVVEDLENLKEVNDELEINHVQNEKEMQEELDFKDGVVAEQARRAAQQEEALEDMEYTLSRFRELVTSLQGDLDDMRASHAVTETESEQLNSRSRAMMDLNMKLQISAAKAQVKAIDMEMRRLDAQEAEQHLGILKLFLPDSYKSDRNSVLALLRFKRLAFKANLLDGFIKERVNGQPHPGHEDDIFFGCDAIDKLTWVTAMCNRFVNSISHCSLEDFAKYEGALDELEPVERALNGWIEGLRHDELKEAQCASELQRTMALMTHLGEVHMSNDLHDFADDVHMKAQLMQTHLESAAVAFTTMKNMAQRVIGSAGEEDELAQYFARKAEASISQTRSAKVIAGKTLKALEDLKTRSLSLLPDTLEAFEQAEAASNEIADLARKIGLDLHLLLHEEGRTEPYTFLEVQACAHKTAFNVCGTSESDLFSTYLNKLRLLTSQVSDLFALSSDLAQTQEFERSVAPWILRSQELKALKTIPVDAEEEIRRLKEEYSEARRAVGLHEEKLSVAHLKIETLESRMRDANAKTSQIANLEAQINLAEQQIGGLKEDIEKQDRELKALEADRDKWKKVAGDSRLVGPGTAGEPGSKAGQERAVATAREMDGLKSEVAGLQSAVRHLREENRRARLTEQRNYDWLAEPLKKQPSAAEQKKALVAVEGKDALGELVKMVNSTKFYNLASLPKDKLAWKPAKITPQYHAAKQMEDFAAWNEWRDSVLKKSQLLLGRSAHSNKEKESKGHSHRTAAARLQIRLPLQGAKVVSGMNREVQIVGSAEWEGLQGRLAAV